ncbi:MAG: TRAP transporter small permease [Candidatus Lambdaproteobacteria bacterium]|nr:TRAP transporter small permease [Candidatus Lambdaproteobacteria bacterium]
MDSIVKRITRAVARISDYGGYVAALAVFLILVLVCTEVFLRTFLRSSTLIADEMSGYLNAVVLFLGLAYTLKEGGFIRVELVYVRLRGSLGLAVKWLITLSSLAYVGIVIVYMWKHIAYSYAFNVTSTDVTETPLYIPQFLMWMGAVILGLQLLVYVLNRMRNLP